MGEYLTKQEFDRFKRFHNMQAQSLFLQIEELRQRIADIEPVKQMPAGRKEVLDKQVTNLYNKVCFLESVINKQNGPVRNSV